MRPIFVIEQEEKDNGFYDVSVSYEGGTEPAIIEALYNASKKNDALYSIIETVHSRLRMTAYGYGGYDINAKSPKSMS